MSVIVFVRNEPLHSITDDDDGTVQFSARPIADVFPRRAVGDVGFGTMMVLDLDAAEAAGAEWPYTDVAGGWAPASALRPVTGCEGCAQRDFDAWAAAWRKMTDGRST